MTITQQLPEQPLPRPFLLATDTTLAQPHSVMGLPVHDHLLGQGVETSNINNKPKRSKKQRFCFERDSQAKRESSGKDGSRKRNRYDNNNFIHHPFAFLDPADLVPPGYENDLITFRFVHDATVDQLCIAFADRKIDLNNINPKKHARTSDDEANDNRRQPAVSREMRKRLKKSHPKGIVKKYEDELVVFLDKLSFEDSLSSNVDEEWVIVHEFKQGDQNTVKVDQEHDGVIVEKEDDIVRLSTAASQQDNSNIPIQDVFLVWDIGDRFSRWVVHTMCRYYDLVSFSKDTNEGRRLTYVCHPTCFPEGFESGNTRMEKKNVREHLWLPEKTFFEYLFL